MASHPKEKEGIIASQGTCVPWLIFSFTYDMCIEWILLCDMISHMGRVGVRTKDGKLHVVKDTVVVELQGDDGSLIALIYMDAATSRAKLAFPGDKEFARYKRLFSKQEGKIVAVNMDRNDRKRQNWQL